ncbi:MAG: hypothetical protein ACKOWN_05990 [Microbacteriaceae bacterium]
MNIQVPLLIAGITATAGVGVGTIAANTGAISIDDLSLLTGDVSAATDYQTPIDVLVPVVDEAGVPAPTPTAAVDTSGGVESANGGSTESAQSKSGGTKQAASASPNSSSTTHGTSSGSATAGGSGHHDDDDDDDDEHEDHDDDEHDEDDD